MTAPRDAAPSDAAVAAAVARTDRLRRCPATHDPARAHTEWMHFCLFPEGRTVLVNLSFRTPPEGGPLVPRVLLLVWDGARWHGEVDTLAPSALRASAGRIDAAFGESALRFADGAFHLRASLARAPVAIEARLRPLVLPEVVTNAWLHPGARFNWVTVPRLVADGTLTVDGRALPFRAAPAYHDHNWGACALAGDFSWTWGMALPSAPDSPWSCVFVRLTDRARARVFAHSVALWKHGLPHRGFRHREVRFVGEGSHRVPDLLTVPRELRSALPGAANPVPQAFRWRAEADGDVVEGELRTGAPARVAIPSGDGALTRIHEAAATAIVRGRVRGEDLAFDGPGILEVVDG